MSVKFTYFGGMAVLLERQDGYKILVDPYINNNMSKTPVKDLYDVDLVVITHAAGDHLGDAADILSHGKASVLCGVEIKTILENDAGINPSRIVKTTYGDRRVFGAVAIPTSVAHHNATLKGNRLLTAWKPSGVIIHTEPNVTYYHPGDTSLYTDMKLIRELYKPNVMVVGISAINSTASCEMVPREAAMAVSWVGPDVVIPSHYMPQSTALAEFEQHMQSFAPSVVVKKEIDKPFLYTPFSVQ
jgi:L-ascorbate metabolism protein UlaG (beta-lactamase superfamily)